MSQPEMVPAHSWRTWRLATNQLADYMGGFQVRLAKCLSFPPEHKSISRVPFVPPPLHYKRKSQLHPLFLLVCCSREEEGTVPVIFHACHSLVPLLVSSRPVLLLPKEEKRLILPHTHSLLGLCTCRSFPFSSHRISPPPIFKLFSFSFLFI